MKEVKKKLEEVRAPESQLTGEQEKVVLAAMREMAAQMGATGDEILRAVKLGLSMYARYIRPFEVALKEFENAFKEQRVAIMSCETCGRVPYCRKVLERDKLEGPCKFAPVQWFPVWVKPDHLVGIEFPTSRFTLVHRGEVQ